MKLDIVHLMKTLLIVLSAKYLIVLSVLIAIFFLFRMRSSPHLLKQAAIMGSIILMLTYVAAKIAKLFYFDPRPFVVGNFAPLIPHIADNGFPSDHTLLAAAIAAIVTKYNWRLGIILWILALLIGTARVLAGVHHTIDILGSLIIAGTVAWIAFKIAGKRIHI